MSAFISQTVIRTNNLCVFIDVYVLYVIRCMNGYDLLWAPLMYVRMQWRNFSGLERWAGWNIFTALGSVCINLQILMQMNLFASLGSWRIITSYTFLPHVFNFQLLDLVVGHILKYPSCLGLIEWFARYIKSVPNHFIDARCFKNIYMLKCSEQMYIILNISYFPKQLPCNTWNMNPYLTISQSAKFPKKRKGRNSISR